LLFVRQRAFRQCGNLNGESRPFLLFRFCLRSGFIRALRNVSEQLIFLILSFGCKACRFYCNLRLRLLTRCDGFSDCCIGCGFL
jgi:hypothetical protein